MAGPFMQVTQGMEVFAAIEGSISMDRDLRAWVPAMGPWTHWTWSGWEGTAACCAVASRQDSRLSCGAHRTASELSCQRHFRAEYATDEAQRHCEQG